jgi:hypothetical protein
MLLASTALTMLLGSLIILVVVAGRRPQLAAAWLDAVQPPSTRPSPGGLAAAAGEAADPDAVPRPGSGELRTVRYRMARIIDRPQEVHATELARLAEGEVVELLQQHGAYHQIRTESGLDGWIPTVALEAPDPAEG